MFAASFLQTGRRTNEIEAVGRLLLTTNLPQILFTDLFLASSCSSRNRHHFPECEERRSEENLISDFSKRQRTRWDSQYAHPTSRRDDEKTDRFINPKRRKAKPLTSHEVNFTAKIHSSDHPQLCSTLHNDHFTVYYNSVTKTPCWVYEYLTPDNLAKSNASRKKSKFQEDRALFEKHRSKLEDYRSSGFDRGHMAAAGNYRSSQEAVDKTFLLSNILPQIGPGFNQGIWRYLEEGIRTIVLESSCVHQYTGPLFIPRTNSRGESYINYPVIGQGNVAVPTHLFKTVLIVGWSRLPLFENLLISVLMPNQPICDSIKIDKFLVTLEQIKDCSGLEFFSHLENRESDFTEVLPQNVDKDNIMDVFRTGNQYR